MKFSQFFIDRPIFAAVLSLMIVVAGALALFQLPISEYPQVVPPTVVVRADLSRREPEGDRRDRGLAARAADQRRRGHALHVLAGDVRRADDARRSPSRSAPISTTRRCRCRTASRRRCRGCPPKCSASASSPRSRRRTSSWSCTSSRPTSATTCSISRTSRTCACGTSSRAFPASAARRCSAPASTACASGSIRIAWPRAG